ncbi:terminase [Bacteroides sp. ET71]|uniref:terminase n=1 Tax=Bacteroides sp. ET71 TaxID=2939421 RepID=UPI00201274B8|nr:terminase [Bacteroides sp. ET71]MCL1615122.1 terminase [Bacteroides sp. ET71]
MSIEELVSEDDRRTAEIRAPFNPITGEGSVGNRKKVQIEDMYPYDILLPVPILQNKLVKLILKVGSIRQFCLDRYGECSRETREKVVRKFIQVRCKHDFPFYAYAYNFIKNKEGGRMIHFKLSYPQRYLLSILEDMRLAGIPIRIILLKARQWGGSTLVQLYIAWIQLFHKESWYSDIVAQDASTSRKIKAMYSKMLEKLPPWLIDCPDNAQLTFTPYEGSQLDSIITYGKGTNITKARDTVITIGTYNNPNSGRGGDISCVHYSEVGLWEDTDGKKPEDIIRSISSSLLMAPLTVEVIESTANGMGNFFYRAYQAAKQGKSNRRAVFVPWFKIEKYTRPVEDKATFAQWLLDNKDNDNPPDGCLDSGKYYWHLWILGATFEAINWYILKRKDYIDHQDMMAEFPSDDVEAFRNSGKNVFSAYHLDKLKETCREPLYVGEVQGDSVQGKLALRNLHFVHDRSGLLKVWMLPQKLKHRIARRYLVTVDVGGRGRDADWSDILVIDRYWMMFGGNPEVVAEWHGHIDHDLLAWKAAQIAAFYDNAKLVIESNTIETKDNDTDGDQSELIFNRIAGVYDNLYIRRASEAKIAQGITTEYGYHTNRKTKPMIISNLVACVRDQSYIERNIDAIGEYAVYEKKENHCSFGAADGYHDDMVMTRAIGLHICFNEMELPAVIKPKPKHQQEKVITEATI